MSDGVAPSKGAELAAKLIARSDKLRPLVFGGILREAAAAHFAEIIDRETKAPQMETLLRKGILAMAGQARVRWADEVRRLLSELEVKP